MRWTPGGRSDDLEDRRDEGGGGGGVGGVHIGIGGMVILLILSVAFKRDFFSWVGGQGVTSGQSLSQPDPQRDAREEPLVQYVSFVLDDTQKTWAGIFKERGIPYQHAKLVLFRDATTSGCGEAQSATGLSTVRPIRRCTSTSDFTTNFSSASVRLANSHRPTCSRTNSDTTSRTCWGLNAGFGTCRARIRARGMHFLFAWNSRLIVSPVFGRKSTQQRGLLDPGDVESALGAAAAVGDDRLQRASRGPVSPDSFTHGSSAQRMEWFQRGMSGGSVESCNAFQ